MHTAASPARALALAAALLALPAAAHAQGASCTTDLDSVTAIVRRDYAGFPDKGPGHEAALGALTDSVRTAAAAAADPVACTAALRHWIGFFRDHHLGVAGPRPAPAQGSAPAAAPAAETPSVRWLDRRTALMRIPDFNAGFKPAIDSVVAAARPRLLATPALIIDVRGNGGGWTAAYDAILSLLYTGPIRVDGMDAWASEGNIAYARAVAGNDHVPAQIRQQAGMLLQRMEAARGGYVLMADDEVVRRDTVFPLPRAVAILVDHRCASTCEQFVLDARQSGKVTVMGGENTGGLLDYGNVRTVPLPWGQQRLFVPTTRSHRLPREKLDLTGIAPAVRIPAGEDAVEFARAWLRAHARR